MSKTKTCSQCKAEIPRNARKCMHCGSKQGVGVVGLLIVLIFGWVVWSMVQSSIDQATAPPKTPAQIAAKKHESAAARERSQTLTMCMDAVRAWAKFPSSVDFSAFSSPPPQPMQGGGWLIRLAFTAKNALGAELPYMARCEIRDGKLQRFSANPR